jgi:hypothetical protein
MTSGLFPHRGSPAILPGMDEHPIAEWLPERYRNVLDRISELEAAGRHAEGDRVRRAAIKSYSKSWTPRTVRDLDGLALRAEHLLRTPPSYRATRQPAALTLAIVAWRAPRRAVARIRTTRSASPAPPLAPERPPA